MITQEYLKKILTYNPDTGKFFWIVSRSGADLSKEAGKNGSNNYRLITIDGKRYLASRLAFLYVTGSFPIGCVDHIDRNALNNSFSNLRDCSMSENQKNRVKNKNNTTGYKCVYLEKKTHRYVAQTREKGKKVYLGTFSTALEAYKKYCDYTLANHGEFANLG